MANPIHCSACTRPIHPTEQRQESLDGLGVKCMDCVQAANKKADSDAE